VKYLIIAFLAWMVTLTYYEGIIFKMRGAFNHEGARAPAQKPYTLTPNPQTVAGVTLKTERAART
tara:strand:- start:298 stop:492 length:195 start_codon:yes stop_codon:yes gene_type:complete